MWSGLSWGRLTKKEGGVPHISTADPSLDVNSIHAFIHNSNKKYTIFTHKIYGIFITFMIK